MKLFCMIFLGAFLWRVRGGLRFWGHKALLNKIWFGVFVGIICWIKGKEFEISINAAIATFVAHQLLSWGVYIGRLCTGSEINPEVDRENPWIDEILFPLHVTFRGQTYYLYQFPQLFGFIGTTMTGVMLTYLMGLGMANFWFGFTGLGMGTCYWFGHLVSKYIKNDNKGGWKWGEWIFGGYLGFFLWIN